MNFSNIGKRKHRCRRWRNSQGERVGHPPGARVGAAAVAEVGRRQVGRHPHNGRSEDGHRDNGHRLQEHGRRHFGGAELHQGQQVHRVPPRSEGHDAVEDEARTGHAAEIQDQARADIQVRIRSDYTYLRRDFLVHILVLRIYIQGKHIHEARKTFGNKTPFKVSEKRRRCDSGLGRMSGDWTSRGGDCLPGSAVGLGRLAIFLDTHGQRALEQVKFWM